MKMILVGSKFLDFHTQDGNHIKGTQLFVAFDEEGVEGKATDKLFIREGISLPKLAVNKRLDITFNRKGKVEAVAVTE